MGLANTLVDELRKHKGKTVMLGVRSSFFFIGSSEEALEDIEAVGIMAKACVSIAANKGVRNVERQDIGCRNVVKTYVRNRATIDSPEEVVILIEGSEFGAFWTRDEYLSGRKALEASIAKME
jgi:hypothetical protein